MRRRGVLLLALLVVAAAVVARPVLERVRRGYSSPRGASVQRFSVRSRLLGRSLGQVLVLPRGWKPGRGLLVLLHGRNSPPSSLLSDEFFVGLRRLGARAPAVALVNGGDHSYYHDRRDGPWAEYVLREALPASLRRSGADARHVAIGGISMGGYGALRLAELEPARFCAVGGHSAALWRTGGETPAGAFDDAEDFGRNDVLGIARRDPAILRRARVWLDVGTEDPFRSADTELARTLRGAVFHVWPGGHGGGYWQRHMAQYLRFYADALTACP